jgi:hypothetical protein
MQIGYDYHLEVTPEKLDGLLEELKKNGITNGKDQEPGN